MAGKEIHLIATALLLASLSAAQGLAQGSGAGARHAATSASRAASDDDDDERDDFMRRVYEEQKRRSRRAYFGGLTDEQLAVVEHGHKMHKDAAEQCRRLLAAARDDLKRQREKDGSSGKVSIGIASAYRDIKRDEAAWQRAFKKHLGKTKEVRARLRGGEYGPEAVNVMVLRMRKYKAIPGFSRHTSGIAVDFNTTEGGVEYTTDSNQNAAWKQTWFHKWLVKNAARFKFKPLATEAWHWDYMQSRPKRVGRSRAANASRGRRFAKIY